MPETGRLLIGMVAGFKSERWPVNDRNGGRLQSGIRKIERIYPDTEENKTNRTYFGGIKAPENQYKKSAVVVDSEAGYDAVPAGAPYRFSDDPADMVRRKR